MPRTRLAQTVTKLKRDALVELFVGVQKTTKKTASEVAAMAGLTRPVLASRYRGDTDFKRKEIIAIGRGLNIPVEEVQRCCIRY